MKQVSNVSFWLLCYGCYLSRRGRREFKTYVRLIELLGGKRIVYISERFRKNMVARFSPGRLSQRLKTQGGGGLHHG